MQASVKIVSWITLFPQLIWIGSAFVLAVLLSYQISTPYNVLVDCFFAWGLSVPLVIIYSSKMWSKYEPIDLSIGDKPRTLEYVRAGDNKVRHVHVLSAKYRDFGTLSVRAGPLTVLWIEFVNSRDMSQVLDFVYENHEITQNEDLPTLLEIQARMFDLQNATVIVVFVMVFSIALDTAQNIELFFVIVTLGTFVFFSFKYFRAMGNYLIEVKGEQIVLVRQDPGWLQTKLTSGTYRAGISSVRIMDEEGKSKSISFRAMGNFFIVPAPTKEAIAWFSEVKREFLQT